MIGFKKINDVIKNEEEITSNYFSLKTLLEFSSTVHLQIPLYQRLYVWGIEEIKLFIEDISEAYVEDQKSYYIGNMMFASRNSGDQLVIDLIDGQQRFTTLWLLSIILGHYNKNLERFAFHNDNPRISFTSRDKVNNYFTLLYNKNIDILQKENISFDQHDESIEPIIGGITNIFNSVKEMIIKYGWREDSLLDFGNYIYEKLIMVQTTVPSKNNLNQIFESLNSGGKQLENHQILKSRLLSVLKKENLSRESIDILVYKWDASSKMNLYLERSVYSTTSEKWENVLHPQIWNSGFESNLSEAYFTLHNYVTNNREPINLISILQNEKDASVTPNNIQEENNRSIIGFSQFLLHTLRIYNLLNNIKNPIPVDSKNLLKFFDIDDGKFSSAKEVEKFINLLFELRFLFDKFVIKWTSEDEDNQESLLVNKSYFNKNAKSHSVRREFKETNKQLSLIQSVLYIVQESKTQYWLTPFLFNLYDRYKIQNIIETYEDSINSATLFIERLDNYLYCQRNEDQNMSELSFKNFKIIFEQESSGDFNFVNQQLEQLRGTFFFRYWFHKTEYLIWKYRNDFKNIIPDFEFDLWSKYKITFKTSIEHIFPQSKDGFEESSDRVLYSKLDTKPILKDYFGNLVLLTVSENSEYSALMPEVKKDKYRAKLQSNYIDSLKSSLIFNLVVTEDLTKNWIKEKWNFSKAKYHLEEQIFPLYQKHLDS